MRARTTAVRSTRAKKPRGPGIIASRSPPWDPAGTGAISSDAFEPNAEARALLQGVKRAEADLRLGGGAFHLEDVRSLLRISRQAIHNRVREGSLFVVKGPGGRLLFPTLQFNEDGPVQGLKQAIAAFPSKNRWMLLNFLVHPLPRLGGETPIEVLKRGGVDQVLRAIRTLSEQSPPREALQRLYERAFAEFGAAALWNRKKLSHPTPSDALSIARALRIEGNLKARRLAEEIEALAHAAH